MTLDPYDVLKVPKTADAAEIRKSYRQLVLKTHPDRIQDEALREAAKNEFQQVQEAYEILSDAARRHQYDEKVRIAAQRRKYGDERSKSGGYDDVHEMRPSHGYSRHDRYPDQRQRHPSWDYDYDHEPVYATRSRGGMGARKSSSYEREREREPERERDRPREKERRERPSKETRSSYDYEDRRKEEVRAERERADRTERAERAERVERDRQTEAARRERDRERAERERVRADIERQEREEARRAQEKAERKERERAEKALAAERAEKDRLEQERSERVDKQREKERRRDKQEKRDRERRRDKQESFQSQNASAYHEDSDGYTSRVQQDESKYSAAAEYQRKIAETAAANAEYQRKADAAAKAQAAYSSVHEIVDHERAAGTTKYRVHQRSDSDSKEYEASEYMGRTRAASQFGDTTPAPKLGRSATFHPSSDYMSSQMGSSSPMATPKGEEEDSIRRSRARPTRRQSARPQSRDSPGIVDPPSPYQSTPSQHGSAPKLGRATTELGYDSRSKEKLRNDDSGYASGSPTSRTLPRSATFTAHEVKPTSKKGENLLNFFTGRKIPTRETSSTRERSPPLERRGSGDYINPRRMAPTGLYEPRPSTSRVGSMRKSKVVEMQPSAPMSRVYPAYS